MNENEMFDANIPATVRVGVYVTFTPNDDQLALLHELKTAVNGSDKEKRLQTALMSSMGDMQHPHMLAVQGVSVKEGQTAVLGELDTAVHGSLLDTVRAQMVAHAIAQMERVFGDSTPEH